MMETSSVAAESIAKMLQYLYATEIVYGLYLDCSLLVFLYRVLTVFFLGNMIDPLAKKQSAALAESGAAGAAAATASFLRDSPTMNDPVSNQDFTTRLVRTWLINLPVLVLHAELYYMENTLTGPVGSGGTGLLAGDDVSVLLKWEEKLWGAKFLTFTAAAEPGAGLWLLAVDIFTAFIMYCVMTVAAVVNPTTVGSQQLKESEFRMDNRGGSGFGSSSLSNGSMGSRHPRVDGVDEEEGGGAHNRSGSCSDDDSAPTAINSSGTGSGSGSGYVRERERFV